MTGDSAPFDIPPPKFGQYRVQHQIGVGAMGPVFRAEDPNTRDLVAIKALRTYLPPEATPKAVDDLDAIINRLPSHPSIVPLRAVGLEDKTPYLVSDFIAGESLDVALKKYGPGAIADILPRVRLLAEALDRAAASGLCHGAIHPRDVIISDESTFLTGIGLASLLSKNGVAIPIRRPYTAPEIGKGQGPSAAADQFALAALTYEWLFGEGVSGPAYTPLDAPALPDVNDEQLSDTFTTALAVEPSSRFANCLAFVDGLSAAVAGAAIPVAAVSGDLFIDVPLRQEPDVAPPWDDESAIDPALIVEKKPETRRTPPPSFSKPLFATEAKREPSFGIAALAATLFLGMGVGLVGGYFATARLWPGGIAGATTPVTQPRTASPGAKPPAAPVPSKEIKSGTDVPVAPAPPASKPTAAAPVPETAKPVQAPKTVPPVKSPAPAKPAVAAKPSPVQAAPAPSRPAVAEVGSLTIDSRPPGAAVTVNGVPRGATPVVIDQLPAGDYTVTMRLANYRPVSMVVRVVPGERARAAASLTLANGQERE